MEYIDVRNIFYLSLQFMYCLIIFIVIAAML